MATPEGWRPACLCEIAEINSESLDSSTPGDALVQYLDIGSVSAGGQVETPLQFRFADAPSRARRVVRSGDSIVSTVRPYLRAIAQVKVALPGLVASTGFAVVRPRSGVDAAFVYQIVQSERFMEHLVARQKGGSYPAVTATDVSSAPVSIPPLAEQRKIAAILSSVDENIEKSRLVIAQLQKVKKAMTQELLTRGMPGRYTRFKHTEFGEIPDGWDVAQLSDLAQVVRGSTPRPARDPRYFGGSDVPWITVAELSRDDTPYLDSTRTFLTLAGARHSRHLRAGTVVLSNSGFGLGVPKILRVDGCANDGIAAFLGLSPRINPLFLYYSLASRTEHLRTSVARGVEQPNLNTTLIGELLVAIPSWPEQQDIVDKLIALDLRLALERRALVELLGTKVALSVALLSGDLRITPDQASE